MQVKVRNAKVQEVMQYGKGNLTHDTRLLVAEGKLVLINEREKPIFYVNNLNPHFPKGQVDRNFYTAAKHPNDKKGSNHKPGESKGRMIGLEGTNDYWIGKIPIIISETEKIEKGDTVAVEDGDIFAIGTATDVYEDSYCWVQSEYINYQYKSYKVLVLSTQFSVEHLQAIVDGKMKDGDKVLVECEKFNWAYYGLDDQLKFTDKQDVIKFNSQGHVTLHKVEQKMYTEYNVHLMLSYIIANPSMTSSEMKKRVEDTFAWFNKRE